MTTLTTDSLCSTIILGSSYLLETNGMDLSSSIDSILITDSMLCVDLLSEDALFELERIIDNDRLSYFKGDSRLSVTSDFPRRVFGFCISSCFR